MAIRLKHKLDLFETFQERKLETKVDVKPEALDNPISSIKADVDSIISGLNDLVSGLGDSTPSSDSVSEDVLNESGAVDQVLSSDLSALPMLVAGGVLVGIVALVAYVKRVKKKKKIKGLYEPAHKSKILAAQMDVKLSQVDLSKIEDPAKKEKAREKIDAFKEKQQKLRDDAEEVENTLEEAFPDHGELLALLRAETRVQVAEIKLSSNLSDSEKEKMESMLSNAKKTIDSQVEKADQKLKDANDKAKNTPSSEQIKRYELQIEEVKQKKSNLNKDSDDYQDKLDSYERIESILQNKLNELKDKEE